MFIHTCSACKSGLHSQCSGHERAPRGIDFGGSMCNCPCQKTPMKDEPEKGRQRFEALFKPKEPKCPKCGNFGQGGALGIEGGTRHYRWCRKPSCDGSWQWDELSS